MADTAWPFASDGIVETVTTTPQPDGTWNVAALGLTDVSEGTAQARTWGRTRTRKNFEREGRGYVHVHTDPVVFARAALERWTREEPVLPEAAAWAKVETSDTEQGTTNGTNWRDWTLRPLATDILRRQVPCPSRGFPAVIEMTVAASRLGHPAYHDDQLLDRLDAYSATAIRCGGPREREAVDRIESLTAWDQPEELKQSVTGGYSD